MRFLDIARRLYQRVRGPDAWLTEIPAAFARCIHGNYHLFQLNGFRMTVDLRDVTGATIYVCKSWEPDETLIVRRLVRPGDRAIDLGAHVGYFTLLFASLVGASGRVLALEPAPDNFELLAQNVKSNGFGSFVQCLRAAAGGQNADGLLFCPRPSNRGDQRILEATVRDGEKLPQDTIPVNVVKVDDVVGSWDRVDFVKIDVQGFEYEALLGMHDTIGRNARIALLVEYWPWGLSRANRPPTAILKHLEDRGFRIWQIGPGLRIRDVDHRSLNCLTTENDYVNLLCMRPDAAARLGALRAPAPVQRTQ